MNATAVCNNEEITTVEVAEQPSLIELSVADLVCVGGGMVNVAFA